MDLVQNLATLIKKHESLGEKHQDAYELTLNGWLWSPAGEATVTTRLILLKVLEVLETHGYTLYCSIDTDAGAVKAPDAWYCCRDLDWQPGRPIYHA